MTRLLPPRLLLGVVVGLAIAGLIVAVGFLLGAPSSTPTPSPALSGPTRGSSSAPASHSDSDMAAEAEIEEELWQEERREKTEQANWIWRPSAEDLARAKAQKRGLYFRAPILDAESGDSIKGEVSINGYTVARASRVEVLMWGTVERPVRLRVEAEGYEPWGVRFRFKVKGLKILEGEVELPRTEGGDA